MPPFLRKIVKAFQSEKGKARKSRGQSSTSCSSDEIKTLSRTAFESIQLVFHCQLAHGSPTGLISGFENAREMYQKIVDCFDLNPGDILFCTLNTHKIDMSYLLGGQIGLDDFIFAHKRGQAKEIEVLKSDSFLGLTITDNGAGFCFIKRIKDGSAIQKNPHICVGDHIERLNDISIFGKRHFEVARMLKSIPTGSTFSMRLIEPLTTGFQCLRPRTARSASSSANGNGTLRFKSNGAIIEEKQDDHVQAAVNNINTLLDTYMGISDHELSLEIWDLSIDKKNSLEFAEALDSSLEGFGFSDDFVIELWGIITDARRLAKQKK